MNTNRVNIADEYGRGSVTLVTWEETFRMIYLGSIEFVNPVEKIRIYTDGSRLYTCDKRAETFEEMNSK